MKKSEFQIEIEEKAIEKLGLSWQLWSISDLMNNTHGKAANESEIEAILFAWELIGLDTEYIKNEAKRQYKIKGSEVAKHESNYN